MNIIDIYDKLKSSYKNYIGSFVAQFKSSVF